MKQSMKDFLLTLVISVVIFAIVAFFLIQAAEGLMGDVVGGVRAAGSAGKGAGVNEAMAAVEGSEETRDPNKKTVTVLFVVMDEAKRADAIFLLGVDPESKSATMVQIPSNAAVTEAGITYKVGDLSGERQSGVLKSFILEAVGITPDYVMSITRDGLSNWVDFLGGVRYNVPRDMSGFDASANRKIALSAGEQVLSGDQVAQLLAFSDWDGAPAARDEMLLGFGRAFAGTLLTAANLSPARDMFYNVSRHMFTDFTEKDFAAVGPALFRFNEFGPTVVRIPGSADANGYYGISGDRVKPMFELYK